MTEHDGLGMTGRMRQGAKVRVLITGAGGFVGGHLLQALRMGIPNVEVAGLDRSRPKPEFDRWYELDLRRRWEVERACLVERPEMVVHLAAQTYVPDSILWPGEFVQDNVLGTANLLSVLNHLSPGPAVILTSSCEVYGNRAEAAKEAAVPAPRSPYAATKLAQEHLVEASAAGFGNRYLILRLFNNFGPGQQPNRLLPQALRAALGGGEFELHGDGSAMRDWLDVRDTCEAVVQAIRAEVSGLPPILNLSAERPLSVSGVIDAVERAFACRIAIRKVEPMNGHLQMSIGDASAAREALSWTPRRSLDDYLRELAASVATDKCEGSCA